ncbi:hypothetical protein EVAR_97296_1 [Eumeta japonica]|uniref:Uncharacterized protein n=1 Tax=Eumeta variegata TaxID=151549 RepID=A0A4C1XHA4_EUMVA|nr:hypothetical protein EVAR_97296_1 [Eumeta japonica]
MIDEVSHTDRRRRAPPLSLPTHGSCRRSSHSIAIPPKAGDEMRTAVFTIHAEQPAIHGQILKTRQICRPAVATQSVRPAHAHGFFPREHVSISTTLARLP